MTDVKKAAFVAVVGRPSAGKSTLVNLLCGHTVAVVSPVPQTTRNAIRGIVNDERGQLVFVDTPGMHRSEKKFNLRLTETAVRAVGESDMVLYVLDASRAPGPEEEAIAAALAPRLAASVTPDRESPEGESAAADSAGPANSGIIAAVNKMDLPGADYGRTRDFLRRHLPALPDHRCFPLSAKKNQGIDPLLASLFEHAPGGPPFYPAEYYTDQEMDFRIAEIIRGEAIKRLREELPHAFYVEVADREFRADGKRLWVRAFIICERESQKGMIVGKGGALIKAIGEAARRELDRIFDWKLELDLRVKTGKNWRHNDRVLRKILG